MEMKKQKAEERLSLEEHDEVNEDEEALSLSNLPLIHQHDKEEQENTNSPHKEDQDFDFCSMFKDSEMCSADEVFFKGQILPLRHSISFEQGFSLQEQLLHKQKHTSSLQRSVVISRSASMDHSRHSRSLVSSSRSSSINSNSSSSTSNATLPNKHYRNPKSPLLPRNQFVYNQPSPSPRFCSSQGVTNSSSICKYENRLHSKKWPSSSWNVFKLGLVTIPPEILNARPCNNVNKNFGSRNSASSNGSSNGSIKKKKKKNQMAGLFGGCKCSSTIDEVRDSRVAVTIKRSASENEVKALIDHREEEDDEMVMRRSLKMKKRHQLSHHRTFEWLKQLSIEGGNDDLP